MVNSKFPLRRFLDTFVPGFILQLGIWYLYRPLLLKYFPNIAVFDDPNNQAFSSEIRLAIFLILAISFGIVINHMSDITIALNYLNSEKSNKSINWLKKWCKKAFYIFTFHKVKDERVETIRRYLHSNRKNEFLKMAEDWAWIKHGNLKQERELIILHQHICSRIRVISNQTESLYQGFFSEVAFAASLFTTFALLLIISLIAIPIYYLSDFEKAKHFGLSVHIPFIMLMYACAVLSNYSLRRRFRQFCSQVITISLHIHANERRQPKSDEHEVEEKDESKFEI